MDQELLLRRTYVVHSTASVHHADLGETHTVTVKRGDGRDVELVTFQIGNREHLSEFQVGQALDLEVSRQIRLAHASAPQQAPAPVHSPGGLGQVKASEPVRQDPDITVRLSVDTTEADQKLNALNDRLLSMQRLASSIKQSIDSASPVSH